MTPRRAEPDIVSRRLRLMEVSLGDLQLLADRTAADLAAAPLERAAAERLVQVVVDLAVDINSHLVVASGAHAPETGRESFPAAAAIGALAADLAQRALPRRPDCATCSSSDTAMSAWTCWPAGSPRR